MKYSSLIIIALIFTILTAAKIDNTKTFAGTWKINLAKSDKGVGYSGILVIPKLKSFIIERSLLSSQGKDSISREELLFDGTPSERTLADKTQDTCIRYTTINPIEDNGFLSILMKHVIVKNNVPNALFFGTEVWSLDEDKNELTVVRTLAFADNTKTQKSVFERVDLKL